MTLQPYVFCVVVVTSLKGGARGSIEVVNRGGGAEFRSGRGILKGKK